MVVVLNMTPVTRHDYRIGVTQGGGWKEIFNSDTKEFWGSGVTNYGTLNAEYINWHGRDHSIKITIPPLGAAVFKRI